MHAEGRLGRPLKGVKGCRADGGRPVIPRVVRRLAGWDPRVPKWTVAAEKRVAVARELPGGVWWLDS